MGEAVIFNPGHLTLMDKEPARIHLYNADSASTFENIFRTQFRNLHVYATSIVKDDVIGEEMVQNVFCRLWEKRDQIQVQGSIKSYLYRSVHNECLNWLKQQKGRAKHHSYIASQSSEADQTPDAVSYKELRKKVLSAMDELPEQCRMVFHLRRFDELNYQEIADTMGITVSTVKNHMNKALRVLRSKLTDYLPVTLFLIANMINLNQ